MSSYFIYYTEASVVCIIIFAIMLLRDIFNVDRQEKQVKYGHALIAFMLYFVNDAFWAAVIAGVLPKNTFTVVLFNFLNYVLMAAIAYTWLRYALAVEQVPWRNKLSSKLLIQTPFYIATAALIITYLIKPEILIDSSFNLKITYSVFQIAVPCIYIISMMIYAIKRAAAEENAINRKGHLYVGFLPIMVILCGLLQVLVLNDTPIFCFSCTILMLIFYISSMETKISKDPLTGLNNKGQLLKYTAQNSNFRTNNHLIYVLMLDINDFKVINDTYGHDEGDRALIYLSSALKNVINNHNSSMFLARYGGDEFIIIAYPVNVSEIETLVSEIRDEIKAICQNMNTPYTISVGVGYDELKAENDTFQKCLQRADKKMYADKKIQKELIRKK